MDLFRKVYRRDLKIAAMRAVDQGSTVSEVARKYQLSPAKPKAAGTLSVPEQNRDPRHRWEPMVETATINWLTIGLFPRTRFFSQRGRDR